MNSRINSLATLGDFLKDFTQKNKNSYPTMISKLEGLIQKTELENPWFTTENIWYTLQYWANVLTQESLTSWLQKYPLSNKPQRVGLVLAGNIPLVGLHDVLCVLLSGNIGVIKLSSKDKYILPFLLDFWKDINTEIEYEIVENLSDYDKVIATGSNNTARYFEYYFRDVPHIIRKNRTSVAVISGNETEEELQLLAEDIFRYFGLGCRNVTQLLLPVDYELNNLFSAFSAFKNVINHTKYGNGYDYQKAIYLLNQEVFWGNNFMLLKESDSLFSPMATVYYKPYSLEEEVKGFIQNNKENIQCVVGNIDYLENVIAFGQAQQPNLDSYADGVDTMEFLI